MRPITGCNAPTHSPAEDVALAPPRGLSASVFAVGGDEFALFEWPLEKPSLPDALTTAEREVAELVLIGLSNEEIARRRGRSSRTVANQVAGLFRKLSVESRADLFARVRGAR